jgi:hypothetical protein
VLNIIDLNQSPAWVCYAHIFMIFVLLCFSPTIKVGLSSRPQSNRARIIDMNLIFNFLVHGKVI